MRVKFLSRKHVNRIWLMLLILSPFAYFAGLELYRQFDATYQIKFKLDRAQAIATARQYARSKGVETEGWKSFCKIDTDNNLYFYYRIKGEQNSAQAQAFAPAVTIRILLLAPGNKENMQVWLAPDGSVSGFVRSFAADPMLTDTPETVTHNLAETTFHARPEAASSTASAQPRLNEDSGSGNTIRRYAWNWSPATLPELKNKTIISVRGNQVVGEKIEAQLDEKFVEQNLPKSKISQLVAVTGYISLTVIMVIFGIFRFAERFRQGEVSYLRILIIALTVAVIFGGFVFITDVSVYEAVTTLKTTDTSWISKIFSVIVWVMLGLCIGFAYGSGEGDLRELYPGKLTSLDTLMLGKIFSGNVARSVIHGFALSGWLLLLNQASVSLLSRHANMGWQLIGLDPYFAQFNWAFGLVNWLASALISVIFILLLPLPFLHRRLKNQPLILFLLFMIAFEACSIWVVASVAPWTVSILPIAITAGAVLLSFFKFDLLTAIITLGASDLVTNIQLYLAQPAPSIRNSGFILLIVTSASLLSALWFYFQGRIYHEDQVRPLYASNLAERLSLQAEVSAAREAQIRLLPEHLPEIRQLAIAATCVPAHEVGGDFYDLFELGTEKIGVFMAEGGGKGLASALTIAFAKGYLMPRIKNDSRDDNSPTEVVRSLKTQLVKTMAHEDGLGFIYAVIDVSDNTLRYAGTGIFPRPWINLESTPLNSRPGEEDKITFKLEHENKFTVTEGLYYLQPGDLVSLLADGAGKLVSEKDSKAGTAFWKIIGTEPNSNYQLQDSLLSALHESAKHAAVISDDLTAVVIQLKNSAGESA